MAPTSLRRTTLEREELGDGRPAGRKGSVVAGVSSPTMRALEERAERFSLEKAEAERRLEEAERRLRAAIEEMHNKRAHGGKSPRGIFLWNGTHPLCQHTDSCLTHGVGSLLQSFLLAYGVRVGIGVLIRALRLIRNRPSSVLDFQLLLSEKNLIVREEACRTGMLFGGFTGLYHLTRCLLRRLKGREAPMHTFVAGTVAGVSLFSLDDRARRRALALYLLARVGQCIYNSTKVTKRWQLWGVDMKHGDLFLFALASAQIMYAFVMQPQTLPEPYYDFISRTGPIAKPLMRAVHDVCRGERPDLSSVSAVVRHQTGVLAPLAIGPRPSIIPCSILHPTTSSCIHWNWKTVRGTFQKMFPFYLALTFVPSVALNFGKFSSEPSHTIVQATRSAIRSTCFLSCFVGIYQGVVCFQRKFVSKDHKALYYIAGLLASISLLIEKKSKRTELALYTLPRAADSLWYILINRHIIPDVAYGEVALFCVCMGGLMYFYENEPNTMAKMLRMLISRFISSKGGHRSTTFQSLSATGSRPPTNRSSRGNSADQADDRNSSGGSDSPSWDVTADNSESDVAGPVEKNPGTQPLGAATAQGSAKDGPPLRDKDGRPVREQLTYAESQAQASEKITAEVFQGL